MKKHSSLWQAVGFAFVTLGGTILHFLYDWTNQCPWVMPFSGVNESTWEHMKLLFWPLFFFALFHRLFFWDQENYWCVKLWEILLGLVLIPVLFYTGNGAFGKTPDWINITIFYITALLVFLFEWWALRNNKLPCRHPRLSFTVLCLIGALFVVFTYAPPNIPLFYDPPLLFPQ